MGVLGSPDPDLVLDKYCAPGPWGLSILGAPFLITMVATLPYVDVVEVGDGALVVESLVPLSVIKKNVCFVSVQNPRFKTVSSPLS